MEESFDLRRYKHGLDDSLNAGDVMPDSWSGHGRMTIRDADAIPREMEERAIEKMEQLADKNGVNPETAARRLVSAIAEKQS